jgi:hypothetical protein
MPVRRPFQNGATPFWNGNNEAIVDACLARDPGLAAERLARHYSSVGLGTLAVLAPEYDPMLVRTALHSVMQARTGGKARVSTPKERLVKDEPVARLDVPCN